MTRPYRIETYRIEWMDFVLYVSAPSGAKARYKAMRLYADSGYWHSGKSLAGLTCRIAEYVPPNAVVYQSQLT